MRPPPAPLIGVVADHQLIAASAGSDRARPFVGVYATYVAALVAAGAMPVLIPPELPAALLSGAFDRVDGVLLTGGGDVDPALYGETDLTGTVGDIKPARDAAELQISRWAAETDKPLLGICRGHQVVNVALGGRLYVDLPSQFPTDLTHAADESKPLDHLAHEVIVEPASRLGMIVGLTRLVTNSRHHQAVREIGQGLVVSARSPDGLIEATEKPDARFFLSVQWHPENLWARDPAMRALFRALVEAAASTREARLNTGAAVS